ncbi:hypothetical protein SODALDRAFT_39091 [Sodiomyces alkalinus F11]|uniref:C2H2-type domain-containing protein n=1 Tax=Sodiomyces alkalinus (strain CBS 110278 / VKM F-3762 / F11) TaxID=1314773 RepID=A0A3N2Q9K7_SODAK|nr:hypothetical protein SODALDRAFT_39091 [Sodiomyces alkalinus F11]ROT43440.1 hypothetical protein SODALDRAFT_39091 [Sodiomyces alkalinus F11]
MQGSSSNMNGPYVREHIYRRHSLPEFMCYRCRGFFKTKAELEDHQRSETSCPLRDSFALDPVDGFDKEKETKLRARSSGKKTEVEKWSDMYRILFELEPDADIPSPFYDHADNSQTYQEGPSAAEMEEHYGKNYMQFLRREMPKSIRREIEAAVDREFSDVAQNLRGKISQFVRDAHTKLLKTFQAIGPPDEAAAMDDPNTLPSSCSRAGTPSSLPAFSDTGASAPTGDPAPAQAAATSFPLATPEIGDPYDCFFGPEVWEEFEKVFGVVDDSSLNSCDNQAFSDSAYCSNGSSSDASGAERSVEA